MWSVVNKKFHPRNLILNIIPNYMQLTSIKSNLIKILSFLWLILIISTFIKKTPHKNNFRKIILYIWFIALLILAFKVIGTENGYWPYISIMIYMFITYWIFYRVATNPEQVSWLKYNNCSLYITAWQIIVIPVILLYFGAAEKVRTILNLFWMIEFYHIIPSFSIILLILLLWIPLRLWMNFDKYSLQKTDDTIHKVLWYLGCIR